MATDASPSDPHGSGEDGSEQHFPLAFEGQFAPLLRLLGVTPANSGVTLTADDHLDVRFGRWRVVTPLTNVREVRVTGPYRWYRCIGARGSLADRGATFGSSTEGGVCLLFRQPVTALAGPLLRHPGLTVTVADRDRVARALRERLAAIGGGGSGPS